MSPRRSPSSTIPETAGETRRPRRGNRGGGGASGVTEPPQSGAETVPEATGDTPWIAASLTPLAVPLSDLTPHPDNARRHTDRDIPVLMASLLRYGQRKPVVGKREYRGLTNVIIAGNGTLESARRLQGGAHAVAWFDGTDDEADEYALVDNRTAELSTWDLETLARQLRTMRDRGGAETIERMGWSAAESGPLLAAEWRPAAPGHLPGREVAWRAVNLSLAQWLVLELAIQRVQERENDPSMPEGRAVELLAADYLGGPAGA